MLFTFVISLNLIIYVSTPTPLYYFNHFALRVITKSLGWRKNREIIVFKRLVVTENNGKTLK